MSGLDAEILKGVQEHAHNHNWQLLNANSAWGEEQVRNNAQLVKGIVAVVADDDRAAWLKSMSCPVVNVSNTFPEKYGFPTVVSDDRRVGETAFEYFRERGYQNFALYFLPEDHPYRYVQERALGFSKAVQERGLICHGICDTYPDDVRNRHEKNGWTLKTLRSLPKPCGIFCTEDQQGSFISFLILSLALSIPSEIAVLGGDNFELHSNMSNPPLSSVDLEGNRIGRAAAQTLQEWIERGIKGPYSITQIPPKGVVSRSTVDTSAIEDPLVARARQYILDHSHQRINVTDIVRAVRTNRRKLETVYQQHLSQTPLQALNRARIDRAIRLLRDTEIPLYQIANLCGFRDAHQMNRVFSRYGEAAPKEIRRRLR